MGLLSKLFETKYCDVCQNALTPLNYKKNKDGLCCKECISKLSPFFMDYKTSSVQEIKNQLMCRENNKKKLAQFSVTRMFGTSTKVLFDENKSQFIVTSSKDYFKDNADVIDCSDILACNIEIKESHEEIEYQDSNGKVKSFNPPSFAYSYDFFVNITVKIPYVNNIRFKINEKPIDNGQETLIVMDGGIIGRFADALLPAKSNNGMRSNRDEVRNCSEYLLCEQTANEIKSTLLENRHSNTPLKLKCPWCGVKVDSNDQAVCRHCGGILEN